ncbi:MAG TPA: glycoside hydrolase family 16 protein, partial [Acidimicrobiia bacterium]|nr:glycoside hydrolase family 16 protein [Acidimicrobiia bacterium]
MPRGTGMPFRRLTVPALALSLVLLVAGADLPAASGNAPRPASPEGGVARNSGTPERTEEPAGPATRPAPVRPVTPLRTAQSGPGQAGDGPAQWVLTFNDEFDGNALDKSKWSNGFGWGQATRSNYGWCDPAANVVSGGVLAQRIDHKAHGGQPFSVGCIHSKDKFAQQYGYWEARIRTARCFGSRSAFWGKPNDESWPPELDVVEVNGESSGTAKFTVHWSAGGRHQESQGRYDGPDFAAGFHTYGAQWTPDGVTWFVDGAARRFTAAGADGLGAGGPFYTIVNSQVIDPDSTCGAVPADSVEYVDWVRIWTPAPGPSAAPANRPPASPSPTPSGRCGRPVRGEEARPLPPRTGEASGAVASQRYPGYGWFIRDSGNPASLYSFRFNDSGATKVREVPVTGAANRDWEDLSYWIGPAGRAWLFIPESGQSGSDTYIYKVPEPAPGAGRTEPAIRYRYRYPDGKYNTESSFMIGDHLVLVTKTNPGRVYRFDDLAENRVNVPRYMGPLVGADRVSVVRLSPDHRTMVAASHTTAYL